MSKTPSKHLQNTTRKTKTNNKHKPTPSFNIDNVVANKALKDAKTWHARRWQTKEGTYRIKEQLPPDVRDTGDVVMADAAADRR